MASAVDQSKVMKFPPKHEQATNSVERSLTTVSESEWGYLIFKNKYKKERNVFSALQI